MLYYSTNGNLHTETKENENTQEWAKYQNKVDAQKRAQEAKLRRRAPKTDRDFTRAILLEKFGEKILDRNYRLHETEVFFVDELPQYSWHEDAPSWYTGYRNMEQSGSTRHLNGIEITLSQCTVNCGAEGYKHFVDSIYVAKSVSLVQILEFINQTNRRK